MPDKPIKPILKKAYGSIPHLPGSKFGNRDDRGVQPDAARHFTEKTKQKTDIVVVTEKLDGTNVSVVKIDDILIPIQRSGYDCRTSPYDQHHMFAEWMDMNYERFDKLLKEGERVCGEWLAQAHGTKYDLRGRQPFASFDIMRGDDRLPTAKFLERVQLQGIAHVPYVSSGAPISIETALLYLGEKGLYGAERAEGAVWRIERDGAVIALAKYVRPECNTGQYLPDIKTGCNYGGKPVWNIATLRPHIP